MEVVHAAHQTPLEAVPCPERNLLSVVMHSHEKRAVDTMGRALKCQACIGRRFGGTWQRGNQGTVD